MSFKEVTLGELSYGGKGSYGIAASAVEYTDDLHTYLRITDINDDGTINKDGLKSVDDENAEKYILKPNDIVFARTGGSTGRSYYYDGSDGEFVFAGFLIKFSLDPSKVNPKYLKYYTLSDEYKGWVTSFNTGSTRGNINAQTYANMKIKLPDRNQQNLLVNTLSSLNDKIELNNRINKNLEEMAQALYKSWFVDFEPFRNGEFEDSELGMIPKGWRAVSLDDVCASISVKHNFNNEKLIFLNTGDIEKGLFLHCDYSDVNQMPGQAKKSITKGDILYSEIRPINKHYAYVNFDSDDYVVSTKLMVIRATVINSRRLYHYLTSNDIIHKLQNEAESRSGTFPQIRFEHIKKLMILIADDETENTFIHFLEDLYNKIDNNNYQSEVLKELRNTLLPKLISGEIRVPIEEVN